VLGVKRQILCVPNRTTYLLRSRQVEDEIGAICENKRAVIARIMFPSHIGCEVHHVHYFCRSVVQRDVVAYIAKQGNPMDTDRLSSNARDDGVVARRSNRDVRADNLAFVSKKFLGHILG